VALRIRFREAQSRQRKRKNKPLAKHISLLLKRTRRQHARAI